MVENIYLVTVRPKRFVKALEGTYPTPQHGAGLFGGSSVNVYKPNGALLLALRREVLTTAACRRAWPALLRAARPTNRRQVARGGAAEFYSGIAGYFNGQPTPYTSQDRAGWRDLQPLLWEMATVFARECPVEYAVLAEAAARVPAQHLIRSTPFSTVTVNRWSPYHNARMAVHYDDGNYVGCYGVMTVLRAGAFTGGDLLFPRYGLAVRMGSRDVLICDNQEAHGNTAVQSDGEWERVSVVAYLHSSNLR